MKSDREFLDGMWDKVSQLEYEEKEMKAAKIRHRRITIVNIITFLSIISIFAFIVFKNFVVNETELYIISIISLTAAYFIDKFTSGGELHENGNHY